MQRDGPVTKEQTPWGQRCCEAPGVIVAAPESGMGVGRGWGLVFKGGGFCWEDGKFWTWMVEVAAHTVKEQYQGTVNYK